MNQPQPLQGRPVIIGEVLFDRFPDGAEVLGGAPFNVAWHLQGFDAHPLFISRVGQDAAGQRVRQAMAAWGMDESGLRVDDTHPTGAVRVRLNNGQPSFDILPDQAYDHIDAQQLREALSDVEPALLYLGSLIRRTPAVTEVIDALLRGTQIPLFVDVNLRAPWWRTDDLSPLLKRARWVKVNDDELELIGERLAIGSGGLESRARALLRTYNLELLIVTRGAQGAMAFTGDDTTTSVAPQENLKIVDTVGAGDAFASVCVLGLLKGWELEAIMRRAQDFASRIVEQRGATAENAALYQSLLSA